MKVNLLKKVQKCEGYVVNTYSVAGDVEEYRLLQTRMDAIDRSTAAGNDAWYALFSETTAAVSPDHACMIERVLADGPVVERVDDPPPWQPNDPSDGYRGWS